MSRPNDSELYRPTRRAELGPERLLQRMSGLAQRLFYMIVAGSSLRDSPKPKTVNLALLL